MRSKEQPAKPDDLAEHDPGLQDHTPHMETSYEVLLRLESLGQRLEEGQDEIQEAMNRMLVAVWCTVIGVWFVALIYIVALVLRVWHP